MSAWLMASICCSPPERLPASWSMRSREPREQRRAPAPRRRATAAWSLRFDPAGEPQVLPHGQRREHALAAGHHHDALLGDLVGGHAGDVLRRRSVTDAGACGSSRPVMHLEERRLAGAVGAEQGDDLALVDVEVEAEEDLHRPVRRRRGPRPRGSARLAARAVARSAALMQRPAMTAVSSSAWSSSAVSVVDPPVGHEARHHAGRAGRRPGAGSGRARAARAARGRRAGSRGSQSRPAPERLSRRSSTDVAGERAWPARSRGCGSRTTPGHGAGDRAEPADDRVGEHLDRHRRRERALPGADRRSTST